MDFVQFDPQARIVHRRYHLEYREALEQSAKALAHVEGYSTVSTRHVEKARDFLISGYVQAQRRDFAKTLGGVLLGVFATTVPLVWPSSGGAVDIINLMLVIVIGIVGAGLLAFAYSRRWPPIS